MKSTVRSVVLPAIKKAFLGLFLLFIGYSLWWRFEPGQEIARNFGLFSLEMVKVLPAIFVLIGLFEVWVDRATIVQHLGVGGGAKSYFWIFILAAPMAGGLLPALPLAHAIYRKGARLTVVLTFLGAVGVGRVPMVLFESTFLGWRFSAIRLVASIPLVILTGTIMGQYFTRSGYELPDEA